MFCYDITQKLLDRFLFSKIGLFILILFAGKKGCLIGP